jgi:hypothetical protein
MPYSKTTWADREVEKPRTYTSVTNADGTITLTPAEGQILVAGTPINAANMNKIENGIFDADANKLDKAGGTITGNLTVNGDFIRPSVPHAHGTSGAIVDVAINTDFLVTLSYATNQGGWTVDGARLVVPKTGLYQINVFAEMYVETANREMFLKVNSYTAANALLGSYIVDTRNNYGLPTSWLRGSGSIQLLLTAGEKIALVVRHAADVASDLKTARLTVAQIAGTA